MGPPSRLTRGGRYHIDVGQQQVRHQVRLGSFHREQVAVVRHQLMMNQARGENPGEGCHRKKRWSLKVEHCPVHTKVSYTLLALVEPHSNARCVRDPLTPPPPQPNPHIKNVRDPPLLIVQFPDKGQSLHVSCVCVCVSQPHCIKCQSCVLCVSLCLCVLCCLSVVCLCVCVCLCPCVCVLFAVLCLCMCVCVCAYPCVYVLYCVVCVLCVHLLVSVCVLRCVLCVCVLCVLCCVLCVCVLCVLCCVVFCCVVSQPQPRCI